MMHLKHTNLYIFFTKYIKLKSDFLNKDKCVEKIKKIKNLHEAYLIKIIMLYIFMMYLKHINLYIFLTKNKFKSEKVCLYHVYSPLTIEFFRELF